MSGGLGGTGLQAAVTPYRGTRLRFDVNEPMLVEPQFALDRQYEQIAQVSPDKISNCVFVKKVGWRLKPKQWTVSETHETDLDAHVYQHSPPGGGLLAVVANHIGKRKGFKSPSDLSGATTGASGSLAASTDTFLTPAIAAGASWMQPLTADQTAFPGPETSGNHIVLDRVLISDLEHKPDQMLTFKLWVPGTWFTVPDKIATIYFSGVAGSNTQMQQGFGQYALILYGNGAAALYERGRAVIGTGTPTWQCRKRFRYAQPGSVAGMMHYIAIVQDAIDMTGSSRNAWFGRTITFTAYSLDDNNAVEGLNSMALYALVGGRQTSYSIPHLYTVAVVPTQPERVRMDVRRDTRAWFQISRCAFPLEGYIWDAPFSIWQPPTSRAPLRVEWYGFLPSGCGVVIEAYYADTTGGALTVETQGAITTPDGLTVGGYATFHVYDDGEEENFGRRHYEVKFTLSGDGSSSPTIRQVKYMRDAVVEVVDLADEFGTSVTTRTAQLPEYALRSISISGAEGDITQETASAELVDLTNSFPTLMTRAAMRCHIDTQWDSGDATKRSILFAGYLNRATSSKVIVGTKGGLGTNANRSYPHSDTRKYEMQFAGMFLRLQESLTPRFDWGIDPNAPLDNYGNPQPWKITDIITSLLNCAGFPDEMIDLPDSTMRLWPSNGGDDKQYITEPLTTVADALMKFIRDYLGGWLIFDPNAGTYGKWKVVLGKRAPYTNVAAFQTTDVTAGKLAMHLPSYETSPPTAPVRRGTYRSWVRKPEGNIVVVSTTGKLATDGTGIANSVLMNNKSYNFYGWDNDDPNAPDPDDPDYLGRVVPIFVIEPLADASDEANVSRILNWVAARVYEVACHGAKMVSFEAPLLLIEHEDDATKKRPLRFYDPVLLDGVQYLVRNVNPSYRKDHVQMAMYELEAPRF